MRPPRRYELLRGRKARFVPGWDCHGLPIELKVLQSMKEEERRELTPTTLRAKAAEFALRTVEAQKEQFKRCVCGLDSLGGAVNCGLCLAWVGEGSGGGWGWGRGWFSVGSLASRADGRDGVLEVAR